jgi:type VI secretion system protein ImpG
MRDELLEYYERELTYLRRLGAEFGQRYPKVASGLLLEPNRSDDPHVERLLEGFAFLAARVHLKLDDEFPRITEALLGTVYPEFTRPIPAMSLVQFELDPEKGKLTTGYNVPKDTLLYSRSVNGVACRFRTCYDTMLWPVQVTEAAWVSPHQLNPPVRGTDAIAALRIVLRGAPDLTFAQLSMDSLRVYLNAETNVAAALYELLCNNCTQIQLRDIGSGRAAARDPVHLPASALRPVGFELDEGVLPVPRQSFVGYRLLTEYFTFPEKCFFLDLTGLRSAASAGFGNTMEIVFLISSFERGERRSQLEGAVSAGTFRLGCTPIINLFPRTSEPILLTQRRPEYQVVADARRRSSVGIYSVEDVTAGTAKRSSAVRFEPMYSLRHSQTSAGEMHFWHASRRPRGWRMDDGSDVFLSFVDGDACASHPDLDAVTTRLLCFNENLPSRLSIGDPQGDFEMPGGGPVRRVIGLVNPTAVVEPPSGQPVLWKLVSLLSLNFVSLVEAGPQGLQELLRLHNRRDSAAGEKQIDAILNVRSEPMYARVGGDHGVTFARGHRVHVDLDEEQFAGGGVYLFGSVLDRFLGLYTSLNSFNVLRVRTRQRRENLNEWPPRAGWKALI